MRCNHHGAFAGALLLFAAIPAAAEAPPDPLVLMKQMDAAMRAFGPGTVDIQETLQVSPGKPPKQVTWRLKMNGWTDYIETLGVGKDAITHFESPRGTLHLEGANKWYVRDDTPSSQSPFALAGMFPEQARPDGWWRPIAKPVLKATHVVAAEYDGEPAWRIEYPVESMPEQVRNLTTSFFAPPLRSVTIGRDDHLPRAWTGFEDKNPSHATYKWRRAPRPYTADEMELHPAPGMLEISWNRASGAKTAVFKGNAPDFSLKSAVGRAPVRLSNLRGRPVLLILKADRASLNTARRFFTDFKPRRLAVLVVTSEEPATVRKALPKGGVPFPVLADTHRTASAPYSAGDAEMVLIGSDSRVLAAGHLAHDVARFRSLIAGMR